MTYHLIRLKMRKAGFPLRSEKHLRMHSTCIRVNIKPTRRRPSNQKYCQPLDTNNHPELETTAFCNEDDKEKYQSLIGSMQWAVSLGRFDLVPI